MREDTSKDPRSATGRTRGTLARWLGPLLITAIAIAVPPAFAVNHYIVLFDGSGSVKDQHKKRDNLWQGQTGDNRAMARIVRKFVDKAIGEMPPQFPPFDPDVGDILSFLIFHTDLYNPSYRPERLFLTNESLLEVPSLPEESDYLSFDASARTGVAGAKIELKDVFGGHSPLIAATGACLPFLADAFHHAGRPYGVATEPVDNTYIIRITDGDYNTKANGADEYNVIQRTAKQKRKNKPADTEDDGYRAHRELTRQVNSLFDIGTQSVDCVFPTHNKPDRFDRKFDCSEGAYDRVKGWGEGFLISYLSVTPKITAVGPARTEKTRLELDTVYKLADASGQGAIRLIATNAIFANRFEDPAGRYRLVPEDLEWSSNDGSEWQYCNPPDPDTGTVACNGGGPAIDFPEGEEPKTLTYRARYLMDFLETDDQSPLYPYARRLNWTELPAVDLKVAPIEETLYDLPRDPEFITLSWLDPRRLLPTSQEHRIDADTLKRLAPEWADELATLAEAWQTKPGVVTPRMLARVSQNKKARLDFASRLFYFLLFAIPAGLWFAWPRRKLAASVTPLAAEGLLIDFNDRTHERPELVALVHIRNTRHNPSFTAGFSHIGATLRRQLLQPIAGADSDAPTLEDRTNGAAPLALGAPKHSRYEERRVASGKELPLFFDARELRDLNQIAGPTNAQFEIPAEIEIDAGRVGNEVLTQQFMVTVVPELGELRMDPDGLELDQEGHRCRRIEYQAGATEVDLCTYRLRSSARHSYSLPVRGELKLQVHDLANNRPVTGTIQLIGDDRPGDRIAFDLRQGETLDARVVVDFTQLRNPIERDDYRVVLLRRDGNGTPESAEEAPDRSWMSAKEWRLVVKRSTKLTDVSVVVLANERRRSEALNAARPELNAPFEIGTQAEPRLVMPDAQPAMNKTKLFGVRLANACRSGHGHAEWRARIGIKRRDGVQFPDNALHLLDARGRPVAQGTLYDSPEIDQREIDLTASLDLGEVQFLRRDHHIEVGLEISWTVYKKEPRDPDRAERFENSARVICHLRHEPPPHVLAIDFGTSAMAIAHAVGPRAIELLRLPQRLTEIEQATGNDRRWDDPDKRNPYFLASEFNVCLEDEKLARTRPDDPGFLDLPLLLVAVHEHADKCFSSLKALISAGFTELPLDTLKYPYLNQQGKPESHNPPPLDEVIAGAYKGVIRNFVEPILDKPNKGYSHVYITHPNTYTQNHVRQLRRIVEQIFTGVAKDQNIVYPDNIHFVSESDAVAYYYLIHAPALRVPDTVVPERERILVYDIGAGTLDLSYLEVDWIPDAGGGYTPQRIRVVRRGGVTKAGDLLDECIARDLHAYLDSELDRTRYLTPIVAATEGEAMSEAERRRMDGLRQQIHRLKVQLSTGQDRPSLELSTTGAAVARLVATKADETPGLYKGCSELRATEAGQVFWEPGRERILKGDFVRAFIDQVTGVEVQRFFGREIPKLDTVILSGRTSLWPGFQDRLRETLGAVDNWIDFEGEADALKRAVVLGVIEREFRWRNIEIEPPKVVGDFGVLYEPQAGRPSEFVPYSKSGDRREFYLQHTAEVQIGLRTNNGFHPCYEFPPYHYYGKDTKLTIQLDFDETGYLRAKVTNTQGDSHPFSEITNISTLSYRRRPWPLGAAKLHAMSPKQLLGTGEEDWR
ncbi:hypothetical protein [Candidatus Thiosymbion oneisti]|uniref:hypothetical protein n=1 Tax=Candidatus Thiosymbion oneisti TaxID=589554 RepID=UPI000B7CE03F|nr:hypothetical protein [Candidatus Thiosymbion oneisti]